MRACIYCRRDKIKCDGARPCSQCTKKGYANDTCIDGCEACRKVRVTCVGGQPCQRCRNQQLECVAEPAVQHDFAGPLRSPRTQPVERVKSACLSCRKDNKKCDDQIPCARCVVRSEECVRTPRSMKAAKLRCEGCRDNNQKCSEERPCSNCVEEGKECVTMPRKPRGLGARVKTACMDCRRDKIKCEGGRPCTHCVRRGLRCVEPSCKACNRAGKASECSHNGSSATTSSTAPSAVPPSDRVTPQIYGYYYPGPSAVVPGYTPTPSSSIPDTRRLPAPVPSYYPAIDPSLETDRQRSRS